MRLAYGFITSQGDTAPKQADAKAREIEVSLPVRVTLLQNVSESLESTALFHYQSG